MGTEDGDSQRRLGQSRSTPVARWTTRRAQAARVAMPQNRKYWGFAAAQPPGTHHAHETVLTWRRPIRDSGLSLRAEQLLNILGQQVGFQIHAVASLQRAESRDG